MSALVLGLLGAGACSTPGAVSERAVLLAERGRTRDAIAELEQHLGDHSDDARARRLAIRLNAAEGRLDRAQFHADRLAEHLPAGSPLPWIELGHAMELAHRYEHALALYDRAAEVAPHDPAGPAAGGRRAARWGLMEEARPRLEEALRRDHGNAELWHVLGLVRARLGDTASARDAYETGIAADGGALENRIGLATLALEAGDPAEALRQYDAVLHRRPRFADAQLGRSWCLISLRRFGEAERALEVGRALGADPAIIARQRSALAGARAGADAPPTAAED